MSVSSVADVNFDVSLYAIILTYCVTVCVLHVYRFFITVVVVFGDVTLCVIITQPLSLNCWYVFYWCY